MEESFPYNKKRYPKKACNSKNRHQFTNGNLLLCGRASGVSENESFFIIFREGFTHWFRISINSGFFTQCRFKRFAKISGRTISFFRRELYGAKDSFLESI